MKIDSNYKPSPLGGTAVATPRPAAPKPGSSAEVTLSAVAAHLAASDDVAPVDLARVKEIKEAIAEGRFPRPTKLGRISAWSENEVLAWIEARKAERNAA